MTPVANNPFEPKFFGSFLKEHQSTILQDVQESGMKYSFALACTFIRAEKNSFPHIRWNDGCVRVVIVPKGTERESFKIDLSPDRIGT